MISMIVLTIVIFVITYDYVRRNDEYMSELVNLVTWLFCIIVVLAIWLIWALV